MPANTDRALPPGGSDTPPAGGHDEDAHPWWWLAIDALLGWTGETVPRLLAALYEAIARLSRH